MLTQLMQLGRPLLLAFDPERAHELTLRALEAGIYGRDSGSDPGALAVEAMGLRFPNPVGIAAGFDKDGRVPDAVLGLGCGFAEVGTVTPEPQRGNPQPRVFRLIRDRAVINRLGFNNGGHIQALARLGRFRASRMGGGIVGVNIGANKHTEDKAADYVSGIEHFYGVASYFMVNISSPNTPGLRDLQAPAALDDLLGRVMEKRAALVAEGRPSVPIAVKIAPDVAEADLPAICDRIVANGADAIAVSNTTLARPVGLDPLFTKEAGGLSGKPLFHRSTAMLARVHQLVGGRLPLIGVGGISSGETALQKIEAGASLIQLYTGLIYEGPSLIGRIKQSLAAACTDAQVASISELAGRRAAEWASKPVEG
ncbi:MAG: quinone-dependent dihydroorotate dehydrogenase [Hyphomicrobiaceae bacterium]|nr:quinone-dependent dihydroorotate dehydrogenase [Hyphomicrobiaceae bacterium]